MSKSTDKSYIQIFVEWLLRLRVTLQMCKVRIVRKNICGRLELYVRIFVEGYPEMYTKDIKMSVVASTIVD